MQKAGVCGRDRGQFHLWARAASSKASGSGLNSLPDFPHPQAHFVSNAEAWRLDPTANKGGAPKAVQAIAILPIATVSPTRAKGSEPLVKPITHCNFKHIPPTSVSQPALYAGIRPVTTQVSDGSHPRPPFMPSIGVREPTHIGLQAPPATLKNSIKTKVAVQPAVVKPNVVDPQTASLAVDSHVEASSLISLEIEQSKYLLQQNGVDGALREDVSIYDRCSTHSWANRAEEGEFIPQAALDLEAEFGSFLADPSFLMESFHGDSSSPSIRGRRSLNNGNHGGRGGGGSGARVLCGVFPLFCPAFCGKEGLSLQAQNRDFPLGNSETHRGDGRPTLEKLKGENSGTIPLVQPTFVAKRGRTKKLQMTNTHWVLRGPMRGVEGLPKTTKMLTVQLPLAQIWAAIGVWQMGTNW
ncbi:hypothetical protein F0562_024027 [Nyssa sinensis]|uniref:Uncharacterized protein n=1 Tax=Nyssa sinensis TaxID=561372 RepID=A0A5J5BI95_9ASTE|nr:hypothetical protein F0562_024027 [Nyssa sinensis]